MKKIFMKRGSRMAALLLAMAVIFTSFAWVMPVNAESTPDMKKANVKWDLKNKKTIKFKTTWSAVGVRTQKVKMTGFKVKKAKKKGYKQCSFTLTFTRDLKAKNDQIIEMAELASEGADFGGRFYFTVVDYNTGECLEASNDKDVTVKSSGWKYSKYKKLKAKDGSWIRFSRKAVVKVSIIYPSTYKDLCIGVGGYTCASKYVLGEDGGYEADEPYTRMFFLGGDAFSDSYYLYSKTDKSFAHFMRVKK